jgi:hypothetical protein
MFVNIVRVLIVFDNEIEGYALHLIYGIILFCIGFMSEYVCNTIVHVNIHRQISRKNMSYWSDWGGKCYYSRKTPPCAHISNRPDIRYIYVFNSFHNTSKDNV